MKTILYLLLFFISFGIQSQTLSQKLQTAYTRFSNDEQLKYASISLTVLDTETARTLFAVNENLGLAPASTLKVITAATALDLLGENYQFTTDISYSGTINNGVLSGDIIIRGSGDPTLGSDRFASTKKENILNGILNALKTKGISKIDGKIIADDAIWDSQSLPQGWIWMDIGNYYGAPSSAICWGENEFEINFTPSKTVGGKVTVSNGNFYPFLTIINEIETGKAGSGDQVYGYSAPYSNVVYLRGNYGIDLKKAIRFSVPDPALTMAYEISMFLDAKGIANKGYNSSRIIENQLGIVDTPSGMLTSFKSPQLKDLIYHFNQKSLNLYGEQLVRVLAGKTGYSISDGLAKIRKYWQEKGLDPKSININDGSGLSPANRVTTLSMAQVLAQSKKQSWYPSYLASLPLNNSLKMKSGTIGDVLCYAGYHKNVCFSIMVNNHSGSTSAIRQKIFTLLDHLK